MIELLNEMFGLVCHQNPGRCLGATDGPVFFLCGRCLGIYSGFLLGLVALFLGRLIKSPAQPPALALKFISLGALPLVVEVGLEHLALTSGSNEIRFITGLLLGDMLAIFVQRLFLYYVLGRIIETTRVFLSEILLIGLIDIIVVWLIQSRSFLTAIYPALLWSGAIGWIILISGLLFSVVGFTLQTGRRLKRVRQRGGRIWKIKTG